MMIFWQARLAVLAVPKTGTQALESALGDRADLVIRHPPGLKHLRVRGFQQKIAPLFADDGRAPLETMALIREPRDWLGSWYRYRARPALDGKANSTKGMSFAEFVTTYLADEQPAPARVGRQSKFLRAGGKAIGVDHLFAYERFDTAIAFLETRLKRQIALPARNVSPARPLDLPGPLEAQLAETLAEDFALHSKVMDAGGTWHG
ncbi:MAG: gamma-glutamyl kinase [Celeribacter sp.]|jgi:hypothetical protein